MITNHTTESLQAFEEKVATAFNNKEIPHPVHLEDGNYEQLIEVFNKYVNETDWVSGTWRQHVKCLLKGVPEDELFRAIKQGKSIGLCFGAHRIVSSAIVGGIVPIALGIAQAIKWRGETNKVVCFLGDMSAETGIFYECVKYAEAWDLPVLWVIENNHKSVCSITKDVWNGDGFFTNVKKYKAGTVARLTKSVLYYEYESKFPHAGAGLRVQF